MSWPRYVRKYGNIRGKVGCRCMDCGALSYHYPRELGQRSKPHCPGCGSTFLEIAPKSQKKTGIQIARDVAHLKAGEQRAKQGFKRR